LYGAAFGVCRPSLLIIPFFLNWISTRCWDVLSRLTYITSMWSGDQGVNWLSDWTKLATVFPHRHHYWLVPGSGPGSSKNVPKFSLISYSLIYYYEHLIRAYKTVYLQNYSFYILKECSWRIKLEISLRANSACT
jgi:hypothetical protein